MKRATKWGEPRVGAKHRLRVWRPDLKKPGKRPQGMREKVLVGDTWHIWEWR